MKNMDYPKGMSTAHEYEKTFPPGISARSKSTEMLFYDPGKMRGKKKSGNIYEDLWEKKYGLLTLYHW